MLQPTWLNEEIVTSVVTVLHDRISPGSRSPTKVILLAANTTRPGSPRVAIAEAVLGHQFNDLRAAQDHLMKQRGWLDYVFLGPGMIVDSESSKDEAALKEVKLEEKGGPKGPISYARLATAMQLATGPQYNGKFVVPIPTTDVPSGLRYLDNPWDLVRVMFTYKLLPFLSSTLGIALVGAGLGYVLGVREQGAWPLRRFGVNLRA
jgi:hypothetical protein